MKFCSKEEYEFDHVVEDEHPEAVVIVDVEGGWMIFDSNDEFETWEKQV